MGRATVATQMCILQLFSNNPLYEPYSFLSEHLCFSIWEVVAGPESPHNMLLSSCYHHLDTLGTETGNHLRMVIQQITSQHNCIDITEHYTHWGQMQRLLRKVWQVMSFCHISFCPSSLMYECQTSVWSYKANFIQCESIKFLYNFHYQIKMNP